DLNTIIQEACAGRNLDAIRDGIVELRSDYKQRDLRGAPNFDSPEKRLAYAVAYHAPHAYCYLDLLSRQQFGPKLFASMQRPLNVLVLGAGIGAETLAMLRWLRAENCTWFRGSQLTLVDRAPWADTRRLILEPMIRDLIKFFELGIRQVRTDFSTPKGHEVLKKLVPEADLILAPSLVTELISEHSEEQLHVCLRNFMKPKSRLLLIDHGYAEFRHVAFQWSRDFKKVPNATSQCQVTIHRPSAWIRSNLLIRTSGLIPNSHYDLSWFLLER
ncbi:MAG: hypothetical protein LW627_11850, partial [Ilumatobacteraceae bacterium]|nr:hypothetical protein [Ilumatobacteraceae bacterium]